MNPQFILLMGLIILAFLIILMLSKIKILPKIFRESSKDKIDTTYLCPVCGSTNWKFANPLKPSEGVVNIPHMVNNFCECRKCGYIGIFFKADKREVKNLKVKRQKAKQSDFNLLDVLQRKVEKSKVNTLTRGTLKGILVFVIAFIFLLAIFTLSSIAGTFMGIALIWGLILHYRRKMEDPKLGKRRKN